MSNPVVQPASPEVGLEVRPLRSQQELRAAVELQKLTWGERFSECVPATILDVCQRVGGIAAGAFDGEGRLLGFVFGLTGVERGELVHWSDMLAVRPESRNRGIGRRLKEFQRDTLRGLGVKRVYWTYDPLVARNAHLNLDRLGVRVSEYVVDMYGETDSELHRGLGTDRFIVVWEIGGEARDVPRVLPPEAAWSPVLNPKGVEFDSGDAAPVSWAGSPLVRIRIPEDISRVQAASLAEAARWRASTRGAFLESLGRGYAVIGFQGADADGMCHYVLAGGGG